MNPPPGDGPNATPESVSGAVENTKFKNLLLALGPGILVAAAAVGGSHLVNATRAGADYGWQLLWVVILVNVFKYPFFQFAQRYTAATGETVLHGYRRLHHSVLFLFLMVTFASGVTSITGVAMITASLFTNFGLISLPLPYLTVLIMAVCGAIIIFGRYSLLDRVAKVVVLVLTISTIAAVVLALTHGSTLAQEGFESPDPYTWAGIGFIIILMGWMPGPIDISAWASLWMTSRERETGHRATMRESMTDFHLGYITTSILAIFFLALGALVMYGADTDYPMVGTAFAEKLVEMYTHSIGDWAKWLISIAAFTAMFSTTLACVDGWPRSIAASTMLLVNIDRSEFRTAHILAIFFVLGCGVFILFFFRDKLAFLLMLAMGICFVSSPILAVINYKIMTLRHVPSKYQLSLGMKLFSLLGFLYLFGFTLLYLYTLFR